MKKKTFLPFLFVLLLNSPGYGQGIADASTTIDTNGGSLMCAFTVQLTDTVDVQQVEVKLGTASGAGDLVSYTFDYDVTAGLPSGFSFARVGAKLLLGTGTVDEQSTYFGSIRVKGGNGEWSAVYELVAN